MAVGADAVRWVRRSARPDLGQLQLQTRELGAGIQQLDLL
jgi:hypothetical protein